MSTQKNVRLERFIELVLQGKPKAQAAREAGYAVSTSRGKIYKMLERPDVQRRIAERLANGRIESEEIIGTLAAHMRGDIGDVFPDCEIVSRAKAAGVSHLIRRVKVRTHYKSNGAGKEPDKIVTEDVELYSAQDAAKQLSSIAGIVKEPALNPTTLEEVLERMRADPHFAGRPDDYLREVAEAVIKDCELASDAVQ